MSANSETAGKFFKTRDKTEIERLNGVILELRAALSRYQECESRFGHGFDANHGDDCVDCQRFKQGAKALENDNPAVVGGYFIGAPNCAQPMIPTSTRTTTMTGPNGRLAGTRHVQPIPNSTRMT